MTADTTHPAHAGTVPVYQKRALVPILGAALLLTCLLAGFAQAADTGIALNENGNLVTGIVLASGQSLGSDDTGDMAECGNHDVGCYDYYDNYLGSVDNGPCHLHHFSECVNNEDSDLRRCRDEYGRIADHTKSESNCYWHAA